MVVRFTVIAIAIPPGITTVVAVQPPITTLSHFMLSVGSSLSSFLSTNCISRDWMRGFINADSCSPTSVELFFSCGD